MEARASPVARRRATRARLEQRRPRVDARRAPGGHPGGEQKTHVGARGGRRRAVCKAHECRDAQDGWLQTGEDKQSSKVMPDETSKQTD